MEAVASQDIKLTVSSDDSPLETQQGMKHARAEDVQEVETPAAKKQRQLEYYNYTIIGEFEEEHCVYLLDAASPGADEVAALIQQCIAFDAENGTIEAVRMVEFAKCASIGMVGKQSRFAAGLKTPEKWGAWETHTLDSSEAQGHRAKAVYYLSSIE